MTTPRVEPTYRTSVDAHCAVCARPIRYGARRRYLPDGKPVCIWIPRGPDDVGQTSCYTVGWRRYLERAHPSREVHQ